MSDYLDKIITKKKDGTQIASVPLQDADAQTRLGTVEDKLSTALTPISGNPISISGLKSTQLAVDPVITFEPIQDLHGQSKPYPAGGGKNKLNVADTTTTSAAFVFNATECVLPAGNYTFSFDFTGTTSSCQLQVFASDSTTQLANVSGSATTGQRNSISFSISEASGYVRFYSNAIGTYKNFMIASGSDTVYAPYENICPISGYDKIEVLSCGKNLVYKRLSGLSINDSGTVVSLASYDLLLVKVVKDAIYTMTKGVSDYDICAFFTSEPALNSVSYNNARTFVQQTDLSFSITAPITGYMAFRTVSSYAKPHCEFGSTSLTYEDYHKTTDLSESLGQTVYGGSLDVRTGKLLGEWTLIDLSTLSWVYSESSKRYEAPLPNAKNVTGRSAEVICEKYATDTGAAVGDSYKVFVSYTNIYVYDASQGGNPTGNCAYKLATPIEIQLTPHEISLLEQYAYVSTNGTSIALSYHQGEMATLGDVAQLGETVNELSDVNNNKAGDGVSLLSYTSSSNYFTIPMDGYIYANSGNSTSGKLRVVIRGSNYRNIAFIYMNVTNDYQIQSLFVKKGMIAYIQENGTSGDVVFVPLIP